MLKPEPYLVPEGKSGYIRKRNVSNASVKKGLTRRGDLTQKVAKR